MGQHGGSLDVAQEVQAETTALTGARDEPRDVGDRERVVPHRDHTEVGRQGGEGVVGDLGLGGRDHGDQRGLPGGRESHEPHVRHGLELERDVEDVAGLTEQSEAGGLTRARGQGSIAEAALAALRHDEPGSGPDHVGDRLAVRAYDDGARRHRQLQICAIRAVAVATHAGLALSRAGMRAVVEVEQRVDLWVHHQHHVAAPAAVPAVGAAQRLELLTVHGGTTVAAVPRREVEDYAVDESRHGVGSSWWWPDEVVAVDA